MSQTQAIINSQCIIKEQQRLSKVPKDWQKIESMRNWRSTLGKWQPRMTEEREHAGKLQHRRHLWETNISVGVFRLILLQECHMSFCGDAHYVQPNACDNSFWCHQTLIAHGTCGRPLQYNPNLLRIIVLMDYWELGLILFPCSSAFAFSFCLNY